MNAAVSNLAEQAQHIYQTKLKAELEKHHLHDFVAIEPISGDYFIAKTMRDAFQKAREAHPNRLTHVIRVGHSVAVEIGFSE